MQGYWEDVQVVDGLILLLGDALPRSATSVRSASRAEELLNCLSKSTQCRQSL